MYEFLKNQWEGKKVCFLGDSITDGVGVQKGERYFDLLDDMIGIKSVGYGVNGASFIGLLSQIDRMEAELGQKATVVATGGLARCIVPICQHEILLNEDLLLYGLAVLYEKNK